MNRAVCIMAIFSFTTFACNKPSNHSARVESKSEIVKTTQENSNNKDQVTEVNKQLPTTNNLKFEPNSLVYMYFPNVDGYNTYALDLAKNLLTRTTGGIFIEGEKKKSGTATSLQITEIESEISKIALKTREEAIDGNCYNNMAGVIRVETGKNSVSADEKCPHNIENSHYLNSSDLAGLEGKLNAILK